MQPVKYDVTVNNLTRKILRNRSKARSDSNPHQERYAQSFGDILTPLWNKSREQ